MSEPAFSLLEQVIHEWENFKKNRGSPQEELQTVRQTLEQFFLLSIFQFGDSLTDGIFVCDAHGVIQYINAANERMVGISREVCLGKNISSFLNDRFVNVLVSDVLETGRSYSSIAVSERTGIQMLETGSPIVDTQGRPIGAVVIDRDISETMTLVEKLNASESKIALYSQENKANALVIQQLSKQPIIEQMNFSRDAGVGSQAMKNVYALAEQAATTDVTVMLVGETGVGKEIIANHIFENSRRAAKPFIKVNCAAIPDHLLESELFGYEKGAFTGAGAKGKPGMFELANHGTLLLDEIGELPIDIQPKLLRAIQQQEIMRVGGTHTLALDIRIIAATNRNLQKQVYSGQFREDLYYRLNVFPIDIPPLRERGEDILTLANHFLAVFNKKYGKNILLDSSTLTGLQTYPWPGNIRELENIIERWCVIYQPNTTIFWNMVSESFSSAGISCPVDPFLNFSYSEIMDNYERTLLNWAYAKYGTTREMGKALKISHSAIVKKTQKLAIKRPD
ncbi:MAG: sigma 54-interacting transcriptional regulator [Oscillospiraceae bacterium]|nr:sigma 54-interacting transcriptional regulator [Oscillospiraceae bacterium]